MPKGHKVKKYSLNYDKILKRKPKQYRFNFDILKEKPGLLTLFPTSFPTGRTPFICKRCVLEFRPAFPFQSSDNLSHNIEDNNKRVYKSYDYIY